MKEKSDMYQIISPFKSKRWSYVRKFEASNTEKVWLPTTCWTSWRGYRCINPDYVDKTGLVCPDCKQICQNKVALTSHIHFKQGQFASLASKTHGSVSLEAPTFLVIKETSTEAPTNTTNTVSSSITPLAYVSTTVSSSADPSSYSTSSLNEGYTSSATIDLTPEDAKIKPRRIKYDALFRAEVIQKKEEGATTAELINIYKSCNLDKTKDSKCMKNKIGSSEQQKKKLFKIRPWTKYQSLFRDLLGNFKDAR